MKIEAFFVTSQIFELIRSTHAHTTQTNANQSNGERVKSLLFCETHRENVRFFFILQE